MGISPLRGMDELLAKLNRLKSGTEAKAARAGINAGLTVLTRRMRQSINGCSASPAMKRAARATIGKRLKKNMGKLFVGKAGFAVGKPTEGKKAKAIIRAGDKGRRGVGISAANIHWPALGTAKRITEAGHKTGIMPASLAGVIESTAASSEAEVLAVAAEKVKQVLAADAAKK